MPGGGGGGGCKKGGNCTFLHLKAEEIAEMVCFQLPYSLQYVTQYTHSLYNYHIQKSSLLRNSPKTPNICRLAVVAERCYFNYCC